MDVGEQRGVDREHEVTPEEVEVGDEAVMDEQPAPTAEGMAVGLLHRRADRGPHVGEEQRLLDVRRELAQVGIAQAGSNALLETRAFSRAIPAQSGSRPR